LSSNIIIIHNWAAGTENVLPPNIFTLDEKHLAPIPGQLLRFAATCGERTPLVVL